MVNLTKTNLYLTTYSKIEPIIHSYFSKKKVINIQGSFSEEARIIFITQYLTSLNRGHYIIIQSQNKETVEAQLLALTNKFQLDEDDKKNMEINTLKYWRDRLKLIKFEKSDIYKYISLRLTKVDTNPLDKEDFKGGYSYTLLDDNVFESLTGLFNSLKEQKCIHSKTDIITFYNAFSGKPLEKIKKRIQWIRPKVLCVYFITRLLHLNRISKSQEIMMSNINPNIELENEGDYWKKMEAVFMDKDGTPMHSGAEEYAKIGLTTLPKEVTIIDNLLISGLKGPINKYDALK